MAPATSDSLRRAYAARMNRVVDHIQANLADPLDLACLARVACFSPFHFHRVFQAWTGETLCDFIHRLRLERAAQRLSFDRHASITEVALDCGFSGPSTFARAFKRAFGVTASEWRFRKMRQDDRNPREAGSSPELESWRLPRPPGRDLEKPMAAYPIEVHVRTLPAQTLAYLRQIGPHMGDNSLFLRLFRQLLAWAEPRRLVTPETQYLSLIHDNPHITPRTRHRWEVALTVPEGTQPDGPIGIQPLEGGAYATAKVCVTPEDVTHAWDALVGDWLPGSGFQPDHRPALAFCGHMPSGSSQGHVELEIALPVRPL